MTAPRRTYGRVALLASIFSLLALCGCENSEGISRGPDDTGGTDVTTAKDSEAGQVDVAPVDVAPVDAAQVDAGQTGPCTKAADCTGAGELASCQRWTCDAGECLKTGVPDGTICVAGNACYPGVCKLGDCKAEPKVCAKSGEPCQANVCDTTDGVCKIEALADGMDCDDGDACSAGETCTSGVCSGGASTCGCKTHADCEDDGNLCNGLPYCNNKTSQCTPNPATVVQCVSVNDTTCSKNTCDVKTGKCGMAAVKDKTACDDDNACTTGDVCSDGACLPGVSTCECQKDADCTDDGDSCNGIPFCNLATGVCTPNPATKVICPTVGGNACETSVCEPKTGKCQVKSIAEGKPCDDGNPCTVGEVCGGGACTSKTNSCVCTQDSDCAVVEDGDACNGTLFCNLAKKSCQVNPATVVVCPTVGDTACSINTCQRKTGLCLPVAKPNNAVCDDGNACTTGDTCQAGSCESAGVAPECVCTTTAQCAKFEDGNFCNGTLYCDPALKKCRLNAKSVVFCPPGQNTACLQNTCAPLTGKCAMKSAPVGAPCDDKQPCTETDRCGKGGVCLAGTDICQCGPHKPKLDCDASFGDGNGPRSSFRP